ncbi:hypothetical protein ACVGVM_01465 [Pseudonocardia bannensis]|uniref:Uncharacterized protein n=1 Tax=Pseudonocardia bannensis TaxID=630973 RepID=A0A848DDI3_9PSEU|nr:hypothetical protein [Pseudonocardia bannensis]NMH90660.1 hypothetical protein [Pseudonocardia bannensis]
MSQLSLFSAEARPVRVSDLAGLLCGPGQIVRFGTGDTARLTTVLPDPDRAPAVRAVAATTGIRLEPATTESGAAALRTAFRCDLVALARQWTRGAVKAVPDRFQLDGPLLRLWALAAGRPDHRGGFLLFLDPHAPETHQPLIAAATRAGLPPARVEPVDGECGPSGPALRISGTRRMQRLVELVGPPPIGVPAAAWPRYWGRSEA